MGGGWDESSEAWIKHLDRGDSSRELLLDEVVWEELGEVTAKRILDVGCGEGRFCRTLRQRGAQIVGIDPTLGLLQAAQNRDAQGDYLKASGEQLPFLNDSFHVVVSYLTLLDIPDFRAAIHEMARVLKPKGSLIIVNGSGLMTANPTDGEWLRDESGSEAYWPVDRYLDEHWYWAEWNDIRIKNYHRPLESYMQCLLAAGLQLESFRQPAPSSQLIAKTPSWNLQRRAPLFHIMRWRKP